MKRAAVVLVLVACGGAVGPSEPSSSGGNGPGPSPTGGGSSGGGDRPCTAIGCVDGFSVALSTAAWKPGTYSFSIVADDVTQECKGKLPLPSCDSRGLECSGTVAMIGESGCALPASAHGFSDIRFAGSPAKVTILVERDGKVLAKEAFEPAYQTSAPNGPGCGPVCKQASATLALREP